MNSLRAPFVVFTCGLLFFAGSYTLRSAPTAKASPGPATPKPPVQLDPAQGELTRSNHTLRVTFPTAMVPSGFVRSNSYSNSLAGTQACPLVLDPPLEADVEWISQSEAQIELGNKWSPLHGFPYHVSLRPDLRDLAGRPVNAKDWGAEFSSEDFAVNDVTFYDAGVLLERERDLTTRLAARPRLRLEFTRNVDPALVAQRAYFFDYQTHERFPVAICYEQSQPDAPQGWMFVEPVNPLPAGRTLLFVVDRLEANRKDALEQIPHLRVFPAGVTAPPKCLGIVGLQQPGRPPFVRLNFDRAMAPDGDVLRFVTIDPPVAKLASKAAEEYIDLTGDFDVQQHYRVQLQPGLLSRAGFPVVEPNSYRVGFHDKRSAVILPHAEIYGRFGGGVHVAFKQVNTGELTWQLAVLPPEKVPAVSRRLREFAEVSGGEGESPKIDPKSGELRYRDTELLISKLGLKVAQEGKIPASSGNVETAREVHWQPPPPARAGLYLLEIHGATPDGRMVGNRSIISCTDWLVSRRETADHTIIRVRSLLDGRPVPGVQIKLLESEGTRSESDAQDATSKTGPADRVLASAKTDSEGDAVLKFDPPNEDSSLWLFAGDQKGWCRQKWDLPPFLGQSTVDLEQHDESESTASTVLITDRNVYRPGDTVHFKGWVRTAKASRLVVPPSGSVEIECELAASKQTLKVPLRPDGSFDGHFKLASEISDEVAENGASVSAHGVEVDFSAEASFLFAKAVPPSFDADCTIQPSTDGHSRLQIQSNYFHGAANASAEVHWRATWIADNWSSYDIQNNEGQAGFDPGALVLTDEQIPDSKRGLSMEMSALRAKAGWDVARPNRLVGLSAESHGIVHLNDRGAVEIDCPPPFPKQPPIGRAHVIWAVDIFSPSRDDAVRESVDDQVQFVPQVLGTKLDGLGADALSLRVGAFDEDDDPAKGVPAHAEVFRLTFKTVKEAMPGKVGFQQFRYRNTPVMESIWQGNVTTPAQQRISAPKPGPYIVRVTAPGNPAVPPVSDLAILDGSGDVEVPIDDDTTLAVRLDRKSYNVDDTAEMLIESPFDGMAMITVETNEILDRWTAPVSGNTVRLPIKIKPSYAPNAFVTVHLVKQVGAAGVPAERFGICELHAEKRGQRLEVETNLPSTTLAPSSQVEGNLRVTAAGHPVEGADVMVYAVSEAWLQLGLWEMPKVLDQFFPERKHGIKAYTGVGQLYNPSSSPILGQYEKGFIIGAGPEEKILLDLRMDYEPLICWEPHLKTDKDGRAKWTFSTRNAITGYRLIAVAQAGADRFGENSQRFYISRPLAAELITPEIARVGDELEMRVLVRESYADSDEATVTLATPDQAEIVDAQPQTITLRRNEPAVASFRVRVTESQAGHRIRLNYAAKTASGHADAESASILVEPGRTDRTIVLAGPIKSDVVSPAALVPPEWLAAGGTADLLVSNSEWFPKLAGMKKIFERGVSTEQVSTRALASALLDPLLRYVPAEFYLGRDNGRLLDLSERARRDIERLTKAETDGGISFWDDHHLNPPTTVLAAWAALLWSQRDQKQAQDLWNDLRLYVSKLAKGKTDEGEARPVAPLRAFALFVLAEQAATDATADKDSLIAIAAELYEQREEMQDTEGRALLALALHRLNAMPAAQEELLRDLHQPVGERPFDPVTLGSRSRAEAIRLYALLECAGSDVSPTDLAATADALRSLLDTAAVLSHQENLWALLAYRALLSAERSPPLDPRRFTPTPAAVSPNGVTVGWLREPVAGMAARFLSPWPAPRPATYYLRGQIPLENLPLRGSGDLTIERRIRTESESPRHGTEQAPLELGDLVFVTYHLKNDSPQAFVRVVDQLPAGLETLNMNMPLIAEHYHLPAETLAGEASLSHRLFSRGEVRLYFDELPAGEHEYTILARARWGGQSQWPAALCESVYDERFQAYSAPSRLWIGPPPP